MADANAVQSTWAPLRYRPYWGLVFAGALFLVFVLLYAQVVPPLEGPDAGAHFRYAVYLRDHGLPLLDAERADISHQLVQQPPLYYGLVAAASLFSPGDETLSLEEMNPYLQKGLSRRATVTPLEPPSLTVAWPLYAAVIIATVGGLLAVASTWLLVHAMMPHTPLLATAAAVVVGLNPQFLFSAVTVTNDTWTAATTVLAMWLAVCALKQPQRPWLWLAAGMVAGLAGLAKYSGLLVAVPVTVVWIIGWRRHGWRSALRGAMLGSVGFLLVAGFWYARLRWLYGEWLPMSTIQPLLPGLVRAAPLEPTSAAFWDRVDWLRYSYWGVFGYGVLAPGAYYAWVHWLMGTAAAGLLVLTIRWLLRPRTAQWLALLLALTWSGAVFIFLLNWIRTMNFSDQGRLLFPAAAAFGLLLVLGWGAFVPTRWQRWLNATVIVVFAGLAASQLSTLAAAYALPEPLPGDVAYDRPFGVEFAPGMQLLGIDLPEGATAQPGVPLPLTLYFTTNRPIDGHYTLFLHLAGNGDRLLYQFDGVPVQGRHPTRQWRPGQIFADRYTISVPQIETDTMAHLSLGFYPVDDPTQRQTVYAPAGNLIGDRIELAQVRLASEPPAGLLASGSPLAVWSNGIQLEAAQLLTDAQGRPAGVDLVWGTDAAVHEDYTVFVQVQDAQNRVLAQMDAWPRQGRWPTSTWRAGERVEDTLHWTGDTTNWARVIAGLYDREQRRLPVSAPAHAEQIVEIAAR